MLLLGLGVVAQDLVGWCRGEDHPRVTIHPARQHLDKLVLASYCLLDKARINLKRQRRRYQTQERKRHPHKCNRANFLPRFPSQDIVSTTAVLKNITATRKTTTVKEGEPGFIASVKGNAMSNQIEPILSAVVCCVLMLLVGE